MDSETTVTGLAELQAFLDQLAPNVEKKLMRGALRAGFKVTLDRAKSGVHSVSGELAASLRISTSARGGVVKATIKAGNKQAFYAHMVEFGTKAHAIAAKGGGAISFGGHEYKKVEHPGARMRPFMRPALDAATGDALPAVAAYLQGKITKELALLPDETK
jgi:HK97 gp10 family phage protein